MKIFIPFDLKDIGGTSSFVKKFKTGAEARGHEIFLSPIPDYDVLLVISRCPLKYLMDAKRKGKKNVQRLDGVYYWSVAGWKYFFYNFKPRLIHKLFSDFTIYQSEYSKYCVEKFMGKQKEEKSAIVYNGVDLKIFSPYGEKIDNLKDDPEQKIFFTAGRFRRKDQIVPILETIRIYRKKYESNCKLVIAGTFSGEVSNFPVVFSKQRHLVFFGKTGNADLSKFERTADAFLFSDQSACPNAVLEAVACGLPICAIGHGSMAEIVKNGANGLLVETKGNSFWKKRKINYEEFASKLNEVMEKKSYFSKKSREIAEEKFSLDKMIDKYLEIIA